MKLPKGTSIDDVIKARFLVAYDRAEKLSRALSFYACAREELAVALLDGFFPERDWKNLIPALLVIEAVIDDTGFDFGDGEIRRYYKVPWPTHENEEEQCEDEALRKALEWRLRYAVGSLLGGNR